MLELVLHQPDWTKKQKASSKSEMIKVRRCMKTADDILFFFGRWCLVLSSQKKHWSVENRQVVVGLEGDVSLRNFGWTEDKTWPQKEPLTAVLHCAGDVRFQQPMQKAAVSLISATLQMQQLASKWKAKRFLCLGALAHCGL